MAQGRSTEIITMIKWIRTSRLSIKELSLSPLLVQGVGFRGEGVWGLGFGVWGLGVWVQHPTEPL